MPAALTYPGVYIEEVPSGVRTITGVATSIALFIGWAPRGNEETATRLTSFADFERQFGGLDTRSFLGYAVKQFYDNGGSDAYALRIASADAVAAQVVTSDLTINASSRGDWASDYRVRIKARADDPTRFGSTCCTSPAATRASRRPAGRLARRTGARRRPTARNAEGAQSARRPRR